MENNEEKDGIIIEELLRKLRESKNWSYNDVAYNLNDTNIMPDYIKKLESGLEYPDWDMINKLSELYMVPVEEFVKAKEYSYEKLRDSITMRAIKWMNYLFGISFKISLVVITIFYAIALVGSLLFFINKTNECVESIRRNKATNGSILIENNEYEIKQKG